MRTAHRTFVLAILAASLPASADGQPPEAVKKAMQEMWRRGTCLLSSVYKPAAREAALPRDLGRTPLVEPAVIARRGDLLCYAVDGPALWAADDRQLYHVDGASGKMLGTYGRAAGLPDEPIQSIAAGAGSVWLATRGRLVRLDPKAGRATTEDGVEVGMARVVAGGGGVWLVGDRGAYRRVGTGEWKKLPDFPGQDQLAAAVRRGFWSRNWHPKMRVLLPSAFATADGLYVVCGNRLGRFDPSTGQWREIGKAVWQAVPQGRTVWALTTGGVLRYDAASGKVASHEAGEGPAAGRPVAMAPGEKAFVLASQPDYDSKAGRFVGGGVSRLDLATGTWTVTQEVDGTDVRFATAALADGDEAWVACLLYDRVHQRGAHPGMAHVKRWRPHASGLGVLHGSGGKWTLLKREGLKTERRWVLGQKGTVKTDRIGPETVRQLCRAGGCLWGVYRIVPEQYYAGYFISGGLVARQEGKAWTGRFDVRTAPLGFAGEQPELMLISHSHGHKIVLADGHPIALGVEQVAGRTWFITEAGLFLRNDAADTFTAVHRAADRLYWRATAAAADDDCVWFGGDGGTVSRLDRKTGRLELVGVAPGRKIERMSAADGRLTVRAVRSAAVLPVSLASAPKLPDAEVLTFDGKQWSAGSGSVSAQRLGWTVRRRSNYLYRGEKRVAFLKGVFRPVVLCEDRAANAVWLGTYAGVAPVALPQAGE